MERLVCTPAGNETVTMTAPEVTARQAEEAVANAAAFTKMVGAYRDMKTQINITFNTRTVLNDDTTRQRLLQKINSLVLSSNPDQMTDWQCVDGYHSVSLADLQGLYLACDMQQQACFTAAKFVVDTNAVTPYANYVAAQAAFDTQLGG